MLFHLSEEQSEYSPEKSLEVPFIQHSSDDNPPPKKIQIQANLELATFDHSSVAYRKGERGSLQKFLSVTALSISIKI